MKRQLAGVEVQMAANTTTTPMTIMTTITSSLCATPWAKNLHLLLKKILRQV